MKNDKLKDAAWAVHEKLVSQFGHAAGASSIVVPAMVAFLETIDEIRAEDTLKPVRTKCLKCDGFGSISWIEENGKDEGYKGPCVPCRGTGKIVDWARTTLRAYRVNASICAVVRGTIEPLKALAFSVHDHGGYGPGIPPEKEAVRAALDKLEAIATDPSVPEVPK